MLDVPVPGCRDVVKESLNHREKAAFVVLSRNKELEDLLMTMQNVEERFNKHFNYPWVILNDVDFTDDFIERVGAASTSDVSFHKIPLEHWDIPHWMDRDQVQQKLEQQDSMGIMYGGMESYHKMCRYYSGLFQLHPALQDYDYYWRIEPGINFYCDITYDPFKYMRENDKKYSFVITYQELPNTIPSLWNHIQSYRNKKGLGTDLMPFFEHSNGDYNLCHFWSNFEIGSLEWLRSDAYMDFFNEMDKTGNFWFERWGDAPIHSLATGLLLNRTQVHYFEDFAYQHQAYMHCPKAESGLGCNCACPDYNGQSVQDVDHFPDSCVNRWKDLLAEKL